MKNVCLVEPKHIEIKTVERQKPGANEILVKIAYCGICTLEQRLYSGDRVIYYPIVPGHEASGIIEEIGSAVMTNHKVGDHVALDLVNRCHVCAACLSGNSNMCETRFKKGQPVLGALSEYMIVRPDQVHIVPSSVPLEYVAFTEPLSCCIRSLSKVGLQMGETLLISGAGVMGMLHVLVAKNMGAKIIVSDINKARLADAKALGADVVIDASDSASCVEQVKANTEGKGVDCCIITTPSKQAAAAAFQALAPCARVNIYTSYNDKPEFPIDMNTVHRHEYVITGTEGRTEKDFWQSTRLIAYNKVNLKPLISEVYAFDDVGKAMESALVGDKYRVLVKVN